MGSPTIVYDGAVLAAGPPTGVARSFLDALRAAAARGDARHLLLLPHGADDPKVPGVEVVTGPVGPIARARRLPALLTRLRADLLHSPVAALPPHAPCPMIATVHDLPWLAIPALREPGCRPRQRLAVRVAARTAAAIIAPSRATADDLARYVGHATAKVHVIPHGVVAPDRPADESALVGPFVVLGDARPRKNVALTRLAHERARRFAADLPPLRFIGPGFGYIDENDKIAALRAARALLHFSRHEGFGLPVLEAFAHGVPVACADIPSLREVTGGAAVLASPFDLEAMTRAILRVHRAVDLRRHLRHLGLARATAMTPTRTAAAWAALHRSLLHRRAEVM